MIQSAITATLLAVILLGATGCNISPSSANSSPTDSGSSRPAGLAGTYYLEDGDSGGWQKITLTLRSDGTYTKVMAASAGGLTGLGGTHSGKWTASGSSVTLSGDATWPAYVHDLSAFRKIR